ncbi:MAG TPA: hypothetical protein VFE24_07480 [Pirellulales bacterium]|jgi:hypothetical protein|nr:hypothetical protein [Pirellulales bacterium]
MMMVIANMRAVAATPSAAGYSPPGPWGVSSSSSAFKTHQQWFPKMAAAGITSVRLFPEWRGIETATGVWNWSASDLLVKSAADNHLEINAILMGSPPGTKSVHAFPMQNLEDWSSYVSKSVERYHRQIRDWEVWNEGNGGFNDGHNSTADYAKLAAATYTAAKQADPQAQVGMTVASFDPAYLDQAILAMAKAGKANHFDFLCVHPYEIADGLAEADGEIPFLWMGHSLRAVLKQNAPERADAPLWITEIGARLDKTPGRVVTERDAAEAFVKLYVMGIAQGFARIQWFEAQDGVGEDQGFGLLDAKGNERAAYRALQTLVGALGEKPRYLGWLALGQEGRGYGFAFEGPHGPVLVAWMPKGLTDKTVTFAAPMQIQTAATGAELADLKGGLTDAPILVNRLSAELVQQARANESKNFPWGGDFSAAKTVRYLPGQPHPCAGVFPTGRVASPTVTFADGSSGVLLPGDIGHPLSFYVHPSFANLAHRDYYVRATVRRIAQGNVGMNLLYEVADSGGKNAYANVGQWFGTTSDSAWQSYIWHVSDACFAKMWGHDLTLRPEQSVPFVLGKLEVSTEKFK